jgi:WD40 repeat protein
VGLAQDGTDVLGDPLPNEAIARMGTVRPEGKIPADFPRPFSLRGAALSENGKLLATYGESADPKAGRPIQIWDARTGKHLRELEGHEWPIRALAISPDGKTLVSSSFDVSEGTGITRIWDTATGQSRHIIPGGGNFVRFSPDGGTFWLIVRDKLLVYRTTTCEEVRRFLGPNITLDISVDGRHALGVSHTRDSVLRMYDVNNNREILKLEGADDSPKLARFSPDGRTVAAIDRSANVLVWEVATGRLLHQLIGHKGRIFALAFSPDGRFLVSGGLDKTIRVWELATGKEVHQHAGHAGIVTVLGFSGSSGRMVSGSTDRTALLWDTAGSLVSQLELPKFTEETLKTLWADLASAVPSRAYLAIGEVAAGEQEAYAFLHDQMEGLLIPSKNNRIEVLLKDLDHEDSLIRQRATRELRKLRQIAMPVLLKVLKETDSAEVRARLRYILGGSDNVSRFNESDRLRMLRLIQLAEQLDTPLSRSTLELLTAECPIPPIVKEAQRVLTKLQTNPR